MLTPESAPKSEDASKSTSNSSQPPKPLLVSALKNLLSKGPKGTEQGSQPKTGGICEFSSPLPMKAINEPSTSKDSEVSIQEHTDSPPAEMVDGRLVYSLTELRTMGKTLTSGWTQDDVPSQIKAYMRFVL